MVADTSSAFTSVQSSQFMLCGACHTLHYMLTVCAVCFSGQPEAWDCAPDLQFASRHMHGLCGVHDPGVCGP